MFSPFSLLLFFNNNKIQFFDSTTTSLELPLYSGWCMKMVKLENRQNALTFYLFIVALEHISCLAVVVINVCSVVLQITLGCENEQSRLAKEGLRLSRQQMKDGLVALAAGGFSLID